MKLSSGPLPLHGVARSEHHRGRRAFWLTNSGEDAGADHVKSKAVTIGADAACGIGNRE